MLNSPVFAFFVQGIPESFMLILTGLTITNANIRLKPLVTLTLVYTISAFFVRQLPFTFGIHSIILVFIMAVYINLFFSQSILLSIVASLSGFTLQALVESVLFWYLMVFLHLDLENILNNPFNRIAFGLIIPLTMLGFVILIRVTRKNILVRNSLKL